MMCADGGHRAPQRYPSNFGVHGLPHRPATHASVISATKTGPFAILILPRRSDLSVDHPCDSGYVLSVIKSLSSAPVRFLILKHALFPGRPHDEKDYHLQHFLVRDCHRLKEDN